MVEIDIWDNEKINNFISNTRQNYHAGSSFGRLVFEGFNYFGPNFISDRENDCIIFNLHKNSSYANLSKDRAVVSLDGSEVIGIFSFLCGDFFWEFEHYRPLFLDVRKDWRNKKIATNMIKRLNEPSFLSEQFLVLSGRNYSYLGKLYARPVIEKEWDGRQFSIIDEDTGVRIK